MPLRILSGLCVALFAAVPAAAQPVEPGVGGRITQGFVQPTLAAFADAASGLSESLTALCTTATRGALDSSRQAFAATVAAFGGVSVLRFGPLAAENRFERLFFWPDARGVTPRQVEALIASADENALAPDGLSTKSVAVQGLPALEFVLFGTGFETLLSESQAYRCRYGEAIGANVAGLASAVETAWGPEGEFARSFTAPAPDRDPYRSAPEVAGELVKALGTGLQFVRDAELLPALGEDIERARGRRAPLWRSDLTFTLVHAQIEGLAALLASAELDAALTQEAGSNLDAIAFDLRYAGEAIAKIAAPAETAFADDEDRERIRYSTVALKSAQANINERLSADLGLTMGFNALDGD